MLQVHTTALPGVVIIEPKCFRDARGVFFESYQQARYHAHGIEDNWVQDNHSRSGANVLRGLHYQDLRAPMSKLVRCANGRIYDVAVDIRVGAPTFGQHVGVELSDENQRQLLVPIGFAHGFVVLSASADVLYKCSGYYDASAEGAIAWDDPQLAIAWPVTDPLVSARDVLAPSLAEYLAAPAFHAAREHAR